MLDDSKIPGTPKEPTLQASALANGLSYRQVKVFRSLARLRSHPAVNSPEFQALIASTRFDDLTMQESSNLTAADGAIRQSLFEDLANFAKRELGDRLPTGSTGKQRSAIDCYLQRNRAVAPKPSLSNKHFVHSLSTGCNPTHLTDKTLLACAATRRNSTNTDTSNNEVHRFLTKAKKQQEKLAKLEKQLKQKSESNPKRPVRKRSRQELASENAPVDPGSKTDGQADEADRTTRDTEVMRTTRSNACKANRSLGNLYLSKCCFCPDPSLFGGEELTSELLGPFVDRKGRAKLFVHFDCANWAPQVFTDSKTGQLRGVYDEYCRARQLKCTDCGGRGATIGCYVKRCKRVFHFRCLNRSKAAKVERHFAAYCEKHAHLGATRSYQILMEAATIADVSAAYRREDSTFGLDAPHSRYTQLRRRETEIIFSRKMRICSHPGAFETNKIIFSHKRRAILKKSERLTFGDRARCLLVSAFDIASGRLAYMSVAGTDKDPTSMTAVEARAALASREHTSPFLLRNLRNAPQWSRSQIQLVKKLAGSGHENNLVLHSDVSRAAPPVDICVGIPADLDSRSEEKVSAPVVEHTGCVDPGVGSEDANEENTRQTKRRRLGTAPIFSDRQSQRESDALASVSRSLSSSKNIEFEPSRCNGEINASPKIANHGEIAKDLNKGVEDSKNNCVQARALSSAKLGQGAPSASCQKEDENAQNGRQGLAGKVKSAWETFLEEQLPKERLLRPDDAEADAMRNMARLWSLLSVEAREEYQERARRSGMSSCSATPGRGDAAMLKVVSGMASKKTAGSGKNQSRRHVGVQKSNSQRKKAGLFGRSNRAARDMTASVPKTKRHSSSGANQQSSVSLPRRIRIERRTGNITHYDELVAVDWDDFLPSTLQERDLVSSKPSRVRPSPSREKS